MAFRVDKNMADLLIAALLKDRKYQQVSLEGEYEYARFTSPWGDAIIWQGRKGYALNGAARAAIEKMWDAEEHGGSKKAAANRNKEEEIDIRETQVNWKWQQDAKDTLNDAYNLYEQMNSGEE